MNKLILLFIVFLLPIKVWACGEYFARALVLMKNGISSLVINPKSISEINLIVDFDESLKLSPYVGRTIETHITILKEMDKNKGYVSSIADIKAVASNPLSNSKGTSLALLKSLKCQRF